MFRVDSSIDAGFGFPFAVQDNSVRGSGRIDEEIHGKIVQVLFTARGERVNEPEFGCGLLNLVFNPSDEILAAATQYTIGQALTRWLGDLIIVEGVDVSADGEALFVEVSYAKRTDLVRAAVRIQFSSTPVTPDFAKSDEGALL